MTSDKKKILLIVALCLFTMGCAGNQKLSAGRAPVFPSVSQADPDGVLVFSLGGEISILNPILSSDTTSSAVEGTIFTGMTKVNEKLEIVPDIARSWTVSNDGRIYTFYLRNDVEWHDGARCTAEDVKFTFDSILDAKVNSVRRGDFIIDGVPVRFNVISPYTVQAVLPKPFAPFLASAGMSLLPKHLLQGTDINSTRFNQNPIGTGPFKFKEWVTGDHVTVERNEKYYGGKPLLSKIIFKIIPDENSRLIALEAGEADESDVPPKDYSRVKGLKGLNVFEYDTLVYTYLGFNLDRELFKDKRVRQALAYATDKGQLINLIFRGLASPAFSPSSPVSWAYEDKVNKYNYNIEKARKLLDEAGWISGNQGIREKDGRKFEFDILVNQGNKEREKAAVILQWQYKKIGVKVNVRLMEWSAMLKIVNAPKVPKEFDALIIGWSLGIDPDSYSIWHSSQFPNGLNFIHYNNLKIDGLLEKGRTTIDKVKRKAIYQELQRIIADDQPYIFLWYPKAVAAVSQRVGGLSNPGPAGLFLNIEKVFVKR